MGKSRKKTSRVPKGDPEALSIPKPPPVARVLTAKEAEACAKVISQGGKTLSLWRHSSESKENWGYPVSRPVSETKPSRLL